MIVQAAIDLIKTFEGFARRVARKLVVSYKCPAGVWTIGYGTTRYPDGRPVGPNESATEDEATVFLKHDLQAALAAALRLSPILITRPYALGAVVSFIYNLGAGAYQVSTLRRLVNAGRWADAAAQFDRWNKAGGQVLPGLVRRRAAERALFLTKEKAT